MYFFGYIYIYIYIYIYQSHLTLFNILSADVTMPSLCSLPSGVKAERKPSAQMDAKDSCLATKI